MVAPAERANNQNRVGRAANVPGGLATVVARGGVEGRLVAAVSSLLSVLRRRIHSKMAMAATPGIASRAIAGQMAPVAARMAATSSGPATAPAWSSALWTAKPRPRPTPLAARARRVVLRGASDGFSGPLGQDEDAGDGQPGACQEGCDGERGDAGGGEGIAGQGERPIAAGPVGPGAEQHQPEDQRQRLTGPGDQPDEHSGCSESGQQRPGDRRDSFRRPCRR